MREALAERGGEKEKKSSEDVKQLRRR